MHRELIAGLLMIAPASLAGGINNTIFLHHFDAGNTNPTFLGKAADADYAAGSALIYSEPIPPSNAPGGQVVGSPARFGAGSLLRYNGVNVGGRVKFEMQDNFNLQRGTIDMWVNSGSLASDTQFRGLWGTEAFGGGPGDLRMYIYNTGAGRTLGAYMIDDDGAAQHWETEAAIAPANLTNNVWHHVAWEWDLSTQNSYIYWDGQKLGSGATNGKPIKYNGTPSPFYFHIGENQAGSASFPGYMDEFRISDVMRYNGASFTPPTAPYSLVTLPEWAVDNSGSWSVSGNWTAAVPNADGATAKFGAIISTARTVTVDTPITVGKIIFDNASSYTLAGTSTLTILNTAGTGEINVVQGTHNITAPLTLTSDTNLTGAGTLTLGAVTNNGLLAVQTRTIAGAIDGSGNVSVDAGKTLTADHVRQNSLTVNGTAQISSVRSSSKTSKVAALTINSGGKLDLGSNDLVVDSSGTSFAIIRGKIISGYASGAWNGDGIISSAAAASSSPRTALGYASNAVLGLGTFSGVSVTSSSILVRYTAAGDANLSGTVDSTDFNALVGGYGITANANWTQGDFNYDSKVSTLDFNLLAGNFGQTVASPTLGSIVPEPASACVIGVIGLGLMRRRSHR
jgi:hypothetical protein